MRVRAGLGEKSAARSPGKTKPVTRRRKLPPENRFFPAHNHSAFPPPPAARAAAPPRLRLFSFCRREKKPFFAAPGSRFFRGFLFAPKRPFAGFFSPFRPRAQRFRPGASARHAPKKGRPVPLFAVAPRPRLGVFPGHTQPPGSRLACPRPGPAHFCALLRERPQGGDLSLEVCFVKPWPPLA